MHSANHNLASNYDRNIILSQMTSFTTLCQTSISEFPTYASFGGRGSHIDNLCIDLKYCSNSQAIGIQSLYSTGRYLVTLGADNAIQFALGTFQIIFSPLKNVYIIMNQDPKCTSF